MRVSSITKNAGKACNNRLYRHIRTFEKIVKNYFVIYNIYLLYLSICYYILKPSHHFFVTVHSVPSNILCDHMKISYSQLSRTSFNLFISSGFAICPFMPVFLASCTSSAKALAVMATIGSFPFSPGRLLIAAVAS